VTNGSFLGAFTKGRSTYEIIGKTFYKCEIKQHMSKCLCYTMILCLTFCYGCKPTKSNESGNLEKPKIVDENSRISNINSAEVSLSSQDSIAIGDIYLGIDEKTFNERRNEFLDRNPRLNGRLIEEMNGDFHNGKLYSINIRSIEIEDESFEPIVQNNNELKQKWEKESHIWTSLYEKKYKKAKHTKINGIEYIVIKRGRCTIEVSDNEH
jgi:hypothetical protein